MHNCEIYKKNGTCEGCRAHGPSTPEWLEQELEVIDADEMCYKQSMFGSYFFYITEEQIEQLMAGKILYDLDEYGIFIGLKK